MENSITVDQVNDLAETPCGCKKKEEYKPKFRMHLEIESDDKGPVENASTISEVLIYLANFSHLNVRSFTTNNW